MKTDLQISHVTAQPGQSTRVEIAVTNTSDVIDGVTAIVDGINPEWVRLERPLVSVFPDASESVALVLDIPTSCPAGDYLVVVHVVSTLDASQESVQDFWLTVDERIDLDLTLTPSIVTGGAAAAFSARVANVANTDVEVTVNAWEPTRAIDCAVEPQSIVLPYAESARVDVDLRGKRPWFGQPTPYSIVVTAQVDDTVVEQTATFNQKPRIPRGVITAIILGLIILLWALIFLWVISEVRQNEKVEKAIATDFFTGADNIPLASIAGQADGRITAATTGEGVERIAVEANRITGDGGRQRVGSVASDEDGTYVLPALVPGTYKLRFSADGYDDMWYPDATGPEGATEIRIVPAAVATDEEAAESSGLDVTISGETGRIVGDIARPADAPDTPLTVTVTPVVEQTDDAAADPGTATVTDGTGDSGAAGAGDGTAPGDAGDAGDAGGAGASGDDAPQTFTQVTTDGRIDIDGLPTPATYDVRVEGDGFDTQTVRQTLGGGSAVVLNTIRLSAASGELAGVVINQTGGRLGDVLVTARGGDETVTATTPTGGNVGEFRFVGLTTPETYILTFERDGFSQQTLSLSLGAGEVREGLSAQLVGGDGTIAGIAVDPDGLGVGGARVLVGGGDVAAETATLTTGTAGAFVITDLPVPQPYTVTIEAAGYRSETVSATLLAAGTRDIGAVTLSPLTSSVTGTVSIGGTGVGGLTVTLGDGTLDRPTTSATNPAGRFTFGDVADGSYTITVSGTEPASGDAIETRVVLVQVADGVDVDRDIAVTRAPVTP